MSGGWTQVKERGNFWGIQFLATLYRYGGHIVITPILYAVVLYFYLSRSSTRRHSKLFITRVKALRPEMQISAWQHYMSFADSLVIRIAAWMGRVQRMQVDFPLREEILEHCKAKRGVIALTAHLGNLEMCRAMISDGQVIRLNIVVNSHYTESFNRVLKQLDQDSKINLIATHQVTPATAIDLKQRLDSGECLFIMADRIAEASQTRTIESQLLGESVLLPEGPFRLALALGHPTYFIACVKTANKRFAVHAEVIDTAALQGSRKQKTQTLANDYLAKLEQLCLQHPLQWFNFYDYWQDDAKSLAHTGTNPHSEITRD